MDNEKVSVITPVYNLASYLGDAIESVRRQSYSDWEHILVDDCSTDRSWEVLCEYSEKEPRIKVIRLQRNSGAAEARNTAIRAAGGRYIAFLDGDDIWEFDKLEVQIGSMKEGALGFTFTDYIEVDEKNTETVGIVKGPDRVSAEDILRSNPICCSTAIYDTKYVGKVYMPLIRKRQDGGLWIRLVQRGLEPTKITKSLMRYRVRPNSVSSNKLAAVYYVWLLYRRVLDLGFVASTWRAICYAFISIGKYRKKRQAARSIRNGAPS